MNVHDFYNNSVNVEIFDDPHTFDILNIKLLNLDSNIDGGTLPRDENFSGTDSASTIKKHTNTCRNSRVLGSFKAKKYIFPRQDKKHPGYFEGKHTDRELLECCCALALAMTQLLAVPSALHPAQKENETVVCVPSQGEVASQHLRQTYQLCFAVHQLHVLVGNQ